jgi:hypothetical protein
VWARRGGGARIRLTCVWQKSRNGKARVGYLCVGESDSSSGLSRLRGDYV